LAAVAGLLAHATHLLKRAELQTIDARFAIRGKKSAPQNVALVTIDAATLQELRNDRLASEFPFPRRFYAAVIDHLRIAGARVIIMDIEFSHPTAENEDIALFEAVGRARGRTVLATEEVAKGGATEVLGGPRRLQEVEARAAYVGLPVDSDGVIRRFAYGFNGLHSLAVTATEVWTGHSIPRATFQGGTLPIDFAGPSGTFHRISFYRVLKDDFPADAVRGKVVIVGATSHILQDIHASATSEGMSGPEIWANATSTLIRRVPLKDGPAWLNLALIIVLGSVVPFGSVGVRPRRSLISGLGLAVVFALATQFAFDGGVIVSFVDPMLALSLGTLSTLAVVYLSETIERERTRELFARFVPGEVVDQVLARTDENLRLGAVERDCTVLFADLRGFTSFSEKQPAERVIDVVNCYLNEMTEAILAAGGTLISYMGDGIMAVFGAPLQQDDHADRAVTAAREMVTERLERFNTWLADSGHKHKFAMGVGLNSGIVMAGNVGSERRVEYTALGDTTNTASRLEGLTKESGHMLFIAKSTLERMRGPNDDLIFVGEFDVRGRVTKIPVWTIPGG
jgi:adenylate cyclase